MFFHAFIAYWDPRSLLEHEVAANQDLHCLQNYIFCLIYTGRTFRPEFFY